MLLSFAPVYYIIYRLNIMQQFSYNLLIYNYLLETNLVSRVHGVAAVLYLQFMAYVLLLLLLLL
jgi:hypothetical protein